jgi:hypothetical protein
MNKRALFVLTTSLAMAGSLPLLAQPAPGDGQGGGGRRERGGGQGGPGGGGWEQMRERMNQETKEQLGVTDEEYQVLQPKIEAVGQIMRENMGGMFGGMGRGRGGPGGGGGPGGENRPQSGVAKASQELRETLENKDASADTIKTKVEALRAAKKEAADKLTKARAELRDLLTPRQEAVLIARGILE